jgi:hypothetical protein
MLHVENYDCAVKCRLILAHEISPLAHAILLAFTYPGCHARDHRQLRGHRPGRLRTGRPCADYLLWTIVTRHAVIFLTARAAAQRASFARARSPGEHNTGMSGVRGFVAVTDNSWYRLLADRPDLLGEVNFWRPSGGGFQALRPGEPFFFKTHAPHNQVVGGGFFGGAARLPASGAWDLLGPANGTISLGQMLDQIAHYRREPSAEAARRCFGWKIWSMISAPVVITGRSSRR